MYRIAFMLTDETSKLLTVGEAAKLLRLHPHTIYRRINRGELRAVRAGEDGPLRIPVDALEEWLADNPVVREKTT
jgi:excisionase family DNA binding protein